MTKINKVLIKNNKETTVSSIEKGEQLHKAGDLDGAIICFDSEIKQHPLNWKAWNYKGLCLLNTNKLEEAKINFEQALRIDNTQPLVWNNLGTYYFNSGDVKKSLEIYLKAKDLGANELIYSNISYVY